MKSIGEYMKECMEKGMEEYMKEYMEEHTEGHIEARKEETRKAVNFDLDTKVLEKVYPNGSYTGAYNEIGAYMHQHGFSHRQGSGYLSDEPISGLLVEAYLEEFSSSHDWFAPSVKKCDLTEVVGETLDMTDSIRKANSSYQNDNLRIEKETETEKSDSIKSDSSKEQNPSQKKAQMKNKGMDYGD